MNKKAGFKWTVFSLIITGAILYLIITYGLGPVEAMLPMTNNIILMVFIGILIFVILLFFGWVLKRRTPEEKAKWDADFKRRMDAKWAESARQGRIADIQVRKMMRKKGLKYHKQ